MVILILFHSGGFRCFKHYYKAVSYTHLDNTTLEFASSSEVSVKVTRVYYIDKFGQTQATTSEREIAKMGINAVSYTHLLAVCLFLFSRYLQSNGNVNLIKYIDR